MLIDTDYPQVKLAELEEYLLRKENKKEFTLLIEQFGTLFPVYFRSGGDTNFLISHYNGAVDRKRSPSGIVFQRSSWKDELDCDVIHFADPTLLPHRSLTIGWGQLSAERWAIPGYHAILNAFRKALPVAPPWRTIHYSSSAGGFQALATAVYDRGSYVVGNNPQIDVSKYNPIHQGRLFDLVFNDPDCGRTTIPNYPWRFNLVELFKVKQRIPRTRLAINVLSPTDYRNQIFHFLDQLDGLPFVPKAQVRVDFYYNERQGHKPLSKASTARLLKEEQQRILLLNTPREDWPKF